MILDPAGRRLIHATAYTIFMSQKAMRAKAGGASDEEVRDYVKAWASGLRERVGIEVRAFGMESVDWSRTYVIMANHASYLDVLALYSTLPRIVGFVAKRELYRIPFLSGVMDAVGCVPIDRSKHREAVDAMREAAATVRAGTTIAIFPEGTRSKGDRIQPLKKGPFHLVQLAQVPILPIGIRGAGELMPRENRAMHSGLIEVHVGTAVAPPAPDDHGARKAVMAEVRSQIARLAGLPEVD